MKANPGGAVAPDNVIGRDRFIERLWSTLDQLSIVLVAERRMGKTSIINKMKAEPKADTLMLVSDVEGVSDEEIIQALTGAQDPWKLEHYRTRLKSYYGDKAGLTRAILDMLAEVDGLNLGDLHNGLKMDFHVGANDVASRILGDRERLRSLVKLMQRDHYLRQESDGRLAFRFNLLRRWWRLDLGLS